jgi:hypothetical protein
MRPVKQQKRHDFIAAEANTVSMFHHIALFPYTIPSLMSKPTVATPSMDARISVYPRTPFAANINQSSLRKLVVFPMK